MSNEGNRIKNRLLGMPHGTASNRLRKMLLWQMIQEARRNYCFRCNTRIDSIDDLSIEHKKPWQSAPDPKARFFDLTNIAFSHLRCNIGAGNGGGKASRMKEHCPKGHPYDAENTIIDTRGHRRCRECANRHGRDAKKRHPESNRRAVAVWKKRNQEKNNTYERERYRKNK